MTWHTINSEHSICSAAQVGGSSRTFCLDTYLSELVKSSPTHETCSCSDNETESCQCSQYGTTCVRWMEENGVEQLTFFAEDSHARTLAQPEREQASRGSVVAYGKSIKDSLEKLGLSLSSRKTHRYCGSAGSTLSSETCPSWGIMLDGECWEAGISVVSTEERECGYWPTPMRCDYKRKGYSVEKSENLKKHLTKHQAHWTDIVSVDLHERGCAGQQPGKRTMSQTRAINSSRT